MLDGAWVMYVCRAPIDVVSAWIEGATASLAENVRTW